MSIVVDAWFTANECVLSACVLVSKYYTILHYIVYLLLSCLL
jgi:hypothetical protein